MDDKRDSTVLVDEKNCVSMINYVVKSVATSPHTRVDSFFFDRIRNTDPN